MYLPAARHYLDFIQHFVKLYQEKRSELEEQQLHLNVGLAKIAETVEQVELVQKSLAIKNRELEVLFINASCFGLMFLYLFYLSFLRL